MRARLPTLLALALLSCGDGPGFGAVNVPTEGRPPEMLSEMQLLRWEGDGFVYNDRVVPYDLNTALFSDYAAKDRAIYVPEGASATYDGSDVFDFPVGTAIIKTFSFAADLRQPDQDVTLIETRVLIRTAGGWESWPYRWNEQQTDAELAPTGAVLELSFVDAEGAARTANYLVPQRNQCQSCHERKVGEDDVIVPIGPRARNLNRENDYGAGPVNQLTHLQAEGLLTGVPADLSDVDAAYDFRGIEAEGIAGLDAATVERAARDYLDVNCGHCHNPAGRQGISSQLFLHVEQETNLNLGICKLPGSAGEGTGGFRWDIVPGNPDESILHFRMDTTEVGAMMPALGRSLRHDAAIALIRQWIANMDPLACE